MPSYGGPIISQGAEEQAHRTVLCSQPQAQPTASSWPPQSRIPIAPPAIVLGLITVPGLNSEPKKGSALTQTLPPQFPAPTLATLPRGLFSPSLQCIKLPYLGASALAVSALFIEILWLFSSKSPPTGVLI